MTIDGLREVIKKICTNNELKFLSSKKSEITDDDLISFLDELQFNNILINILIIKL